MDSASSIMRIFGSAITEIANFRRDAMPEEYVRIGRSIASPSAESSTAAANCSSDRSGDIPRARNPILMFSAPVRSPISAALTPSSCGRALVMTTPEVGGSTPHEHSQESRLPGAVPADDADELPFPRGEVCTSHSRDGDHLAATGKFAPQPFPRRAVRAGDLVPHAHAVRDHGERGVLRRHPEVARDLRLPAPLAASRSQRSSRP